MFCKRSHRRMGDRRARSEHEQCQRRTRDGDLALSVMESHSLLVLVDPTVLHVEVTQAVSEPREYMEVTHG